MEPTADRPYMPGYGIAPAVGGDGLLPWSWAEERLRASHDYWVATVRPDRAPHLMPVWGVWLEDAAWFSSGRRSRKARNLEAGSRCSLSTDRAHQPVVVEGPVRRVTDRDDIARFLAASNAKYDADYDIDFLDPDVNGTYRLRPEWAFALDEDDFSGSPTRWRFTG
jgi:Pyridoxamine 5'-phosphate oxidase